MSWTTMTSEQQRQACDSIVSICLAMGASLRTAHLVAGHFAAGLDREQRPSAGGLRGAETARPQVSLPTAYP